MTASIRRPVRLLVFSAVSLVIGMVLAIVLMNVFPHAVVFGTTSDNRNTQVINAVTRQEQVVLVSLGIQGIAERNEKSQFFGLDIPGSTRAMFVQYEFEAKLGIDGKDVEVERSGDDEYLVKIPAFIFIGHDNETFTLVAEDNGVLSFVTPSIDAFEAVNTILNDDAQDEYLEANRETLKDQAKVFYSSILKSIDPDISVRFEFRQERR